jgi:hypothetical protein
MNKRLLTAAAAVTMLAAFASTATAAPTPDYTVTCTVGGQSRANWSRVKLQSVTFDWTTAAGPVSRTVPVFSAHPPRGFALIVTPAFATSLTVTFHRTSGDDDPVTQGCTAS